MRPELSLLAGCAGGTWLCTATTSAALDGNDQAGAAVPPVAFIQPSDYGSDVVGPPKGPPLTLPEVSSVPPAQQAQLVGERLLERILPTAPKLANKVVGMFMPMGTEALVAL